MSAPPRPALPAPTLLSVERILASLPTPSSPNVLQRGPDGSFSICCEKTIDILTPEAGLGVQAAKDDTFKATYTSSWMNEDKTLQSDAAAAAAQQQQEASTVTDSSDLVRPVKCLRTKINVPTLDGATEWGLEHSDDPRSLAVNAWYGRDERQWRSCCWSPSSIDKLGGSVLACLTSNLDVFIYSARKDPLQGVWSEVDALTPRLIAATEWPVDKAPKDVTLDAEYHVKRTFSCQTMSLAWSPQAEVTPRSPATGRPSTSNVLALGHRSGRVTFWSPNIDGKLDLVLSYRLSHLHISSLSWTEWTSVDPSHSFADLAYTLPDGSVFVVTVTLSMDPTVEPRLQISEATTIHPADQRPLTALVWIAKPGRLLAYTKPGEILLWAHPISQGEVGWKGTQRLRTSKHGNWAGASKFAGCSGISSLSPTSLVVSLSDGSFHIVEHLDAPSPVINLPVSRYHSKVARGIVVELMDDEFTVKSSRESGATRAAGVIALGNGLWATIHQASPQHDISYQSANLEQATFVVCEIPTHQQPQFGTYMRTLQHALDHSTNALLEAPSRVLLPSLLPLLSKSPANLLDHTSPHIVRAISQLPSLLSRPSATTTPCPETLDEVREWFREGLRRDLWGPTGLGTLRLRYVVARYLADIDGPKKEAFAQKRDELSGLVVLQSLRIIAEWADRAQGFIVSSMDRLLLTRLLHALLSLYIYPSLPSSFLPPTKDIKNSAGGVFDLVLALDLPLLSDPLDIEKLLNSPEDQLLGVDQQQQGKDHQIVFFERGDIGSGEVGQKCPSCAASVPFGNLDVGVCDNGHVWDRCSLTFELITTPQTRKCIGCLRPALLDLDGTNSFAALAIENGQDAAELAGANRAGANGEAEEYAEASLEAAVEKAATADVVEKVEVPVTREGEAGQVAPVATAANGEAFATAHKVGEGTAAFGADDGDDTMDVDVGTPGEEQEQEAAACSAAIEAGNDVEMTAAPSEEQQVSNKGEGKKAAPAEEEVVMVDRRGDAEPQHEPSKSAKGGESWMMEELLQAASCCLYCGGRFMLAI